jgi:hypothetical protein
MKILIVLCTLLYVSLTWAQSQEITNPAPPITSEAKGADKSENKTKAKQPESANLPSSIDVKTGEKLEIYFDERKGEANAESTKWTDPLSIFTGLLVGVTAVLAVFTYLLWNSATKASDRQAMEMKDSLRIAQESTDAAKQSANASMNMVATMERNARTELRAFVGIERIFIIEKSPLAAKVYIRNSGKTIAREVKITIGGMLYTVAMPDFDSGDKQGKIIIMPNEICGFTPDLTCKSGDYTAFRLDGFGIIYVWGRIDYLDVFNDSHWTTFRMRHGERVPDGWLTKYCDDGNDAD